MTANIPPKNDVMNHPSSPIPDGAVFKQHLRQSSVTRKYYVPQPPLHAEEAIVHRRSRKFNVETIVKDNPYEMRARAQTIENGPTFQAASTADGLDHNPLLSSPDGAPIFQKMNTEEKMDEIQRIKDSLTRKLSKSFRPDQDELYDRGIYVTDPKVSSGSIQYTLYAIEPTICNFHTPYSAENFK